MRLLKQVKRRDFLKAAAVVAVPLVVSGPVLGLDGSTAANSRITIGGIGVGSQGRGDLRGFTNRGDTQILAVCDVSASSRNSAKSDVDKKYGNTDCKTYIDFQELIGRDDIDAVMIATPHHWHAAMTIAACKQGKDVYCEKPLALTIEDGRAMIEAARKYDRVVTGGSQRVLGDYGNLARDVRSGKYGEVKEVFVSCGSPPVRCNLPAQTEPDPNEFHWNLWLGPAPWAEYHKDRIPGYFTGEAFKKKAGWRYWREYSGGALSDWGGHLFGAAQFALDMDESGPVEVVPPDGKEQKYLMFRYANGVKMYHIDIFKNGGGNGIRVVGTEKNSAAVREIDMPVYRGEGGIIGDFIACIRERKRPFRDVAVSHRTSSVCALANIAYELGRPLKWDPEKEEFTGDDEANALRGRNYRSPWTLS